MKPSYADAYIEFLIYFHTVRDYFECHEVMEEFWKSRPQDPMRDTYEGLIQLAVSLYHHRRGNRAGAVKMLSSSMEMMQDEHLEALGIDATALREQLVGRLQLLRLAGLPYTDLELPFRDAELLAMCRKAAEAAGRGGWGEPSDMSDRFLLNKHTLRDRTAVRQERELQRERKRDLRAKREEA
ncbi:DUF309 domain-containing protein [Paenibacillus filicis]|uniref:DUF309 domain-containing protein n=1 Tax=Paenibacillus gyeongsangnamensis TaxID=3388067 RepID=A0ABT4Q8C3_9BACL|nr:DUF309 domain-containing protein [Paenibacillus filicis]MCZ8513074.1 DUF309 domain-containing protein [Paenibacillus filicis]